jgi:primase-polymerase (primpol)-like protein
MVDIVTLVLWQICSIANPANFDQDPNPTIKEKVGKSLKFLSEVSYEINRPNLTAGISCHRIRNASIPYRESKSSKNQYRPHTTITINMNTGSGPMRSWVTVIVLPVSCNTGMFPWRSSTLYAAEDHRQSPHESLSHLYRRT